jgi:hypothetical protein
MLPSTAWIATTLNGYQELHAFHFVIWMSYKCMHIVMITSVTDVLGHLVLWFGPCLLLLSTFEHKLFLINPGFLLLLLYLCFSVQ